MTPILVCDPNGDTAEMYALGLSLEGFAPILASDCDQALAQLRTYPISAVVVDGLALLHARGRTTLDVRAQAEKSNIPILVIADWIDAAVVGEGRNLACRAIVLKPCMPDSLAALVRAALHDTAQSAAIPSYARS